MNSIMGNDDYSICDPPSQHHTIFFAGDETNQKTEHHLNLCRAYGIPLHQGGLSFYNRGVIRRDIFSHDYGVALLRLSLSIIT